ncbi:hypothetical protein J6590_072976 [Homalodisca vitripennis]|nr:hypothetical protein J6590_072976 [Homalodisca vitripennis]
MRPDDRCLRIPKAPKKACGRGQDKEKTHLQLLYKLVNGKLDCPDLLRQVNFYIPRGTRSKAVFGRVYRPTSYASNCGLARMQRTGGLVCDGLDFFQGSWLSFKWRCSRACRL